MEIYLDNAATTKVDSKVAKRVNEIFTSDFGNYSSQHVVGKKVKVAVEEARAKIAKFIGATAKEIVFTSGGTESNNLALRGLAKANPGKKHIITSVIEHPSVLDTCKDLEKDGYSVDYIGVDSGGIVNVSEIEDKIRGDTLVVSIMHVNNEIGTIQPIKEIGTICMENGIYFHSDAVQSFKKIDLDVKKMNIDLLSVSGHKVNAPKGIGFLYVGKNVPISEIMTGGGQENGIRSGTLNSPGIVGLGASLDVDVNKEDIRKMRDLIMEGLLKIPGSKINGSTEDRIYNNINISFYGVEGEGLMLRLDDEGIYVSNGSACASTKLVESYVLKVIDVPKEYIHGSLRLTLGEITLEEANYVVDKITRKVEELRSLSPFELKLDKLRN